MKRNRPVIHLPRTPLENVLEALAVCCLIGLIVVALWGWLILPAIQSRITPIFFTDSAKYSH